MLKRILHGRWDMGNGQNWCVFPFAFAISHQAAALFSAPP
jgi:hypothetical protein